MGSGKKTSLKEIIAYEKSQMLPHQFFVSYVLAPAYLIFTAGLLAAFAIFMGVDASRFLPEGLLCLGIWALLSAALLLTIPFTRREAIRAALFQYDWEAGETAPREEYLWVSAEGTAAVFDKTGMTLDGRFYPYGGLSKRLVTDNLYKRIHILVEFKASEEETVSLPLKAVLLKMLETFEISLDNQRQLEYLLRQREDALRQIYDRGHIKERKNPHESA